MKYDHNDFQSDVFLLFAVVGAYLTIGTFFFFSDLWNPLVK